MATLINIGNNIKVNPKFISYFEGLEIVLANKHRYTVTADVIELVKAYVENRNTGALHYKGKVSSVSNLPSTGNIDGDMYLVTGENKYYAWNGTSWDEAPTIVNISSLETSLATEVSRAQAKEAELQEAIADQNDEIADFKETITDQVNNYQPVQITGDVTNAADEEDLTSENNLLKLKNRSALNGMGYVILRRGSSFASQVTLSNTIYEVRYNFDLDGAEVTIPSGCTLKFEGGKLTNGALNGNNTALIDCSFYQCSFSGSFTSNNAKVSWFNSESDEASVISTMKLASKCSGNTADFEGISKNITAPIVVNQDMLCNIKNANFTFNPTADNQCLFVFDTDAQGNSDRYMIDCNFTQNSSSTFKGISCLHYKNWKNYNGAIWRNIRVNNFTGYFFVNSSYLQEALIENVVCQSTAGFMSYDTNNVYSNRKGSSNIVTIINSSLNGSADTAKYSAVTTANDLYDCMQIDYINCVFQGRLYGGKNSFTIGSGTNSTYTPIVTFNKVWIEYVNKQTGVYDISIESGCKLNITANPLSINIGSNDVCIDYNALGIAYTDNIIDNIHFDEGVYIAELNINSNQHSRDYSLNLEKIINWMNRGIMVSFNSKVCYGTLSSQNVIRASGHIRKNNCFNYLNYIVNNYMPKRKNVNVALDKVDGVNVVTLENDGNGTIGFNDYPWLLCGEGFIKPKMTIIVDVIYRVTPLSTITEDNKTSIYYRPPIKFENASYKEYFEVGDVGGTPKSWVRTTLMSSLADAATSGSFVTRNALNVVGCKMEIAMLNIYFHHAQIDEIIAIDSENDKLVKLSMNDEIAIINSGVTAKRPILTANFAGFQYFDTDLGKPIYWTGSKWVDANGADLT